VFRKSQTHRKVGTESHGSYKEIAGLPERGDPAFFIFINEGEAQHGREVSA
jgi:hypothetical protein